MEEEGGGEGREEGGGEGREEEGEEGIVVVVVVVVVKYNLSFYEEIIHLL